MDIASKSSRAKQVVNNIQRLFIHSTFDAPFVKESFVVKRLLTNTRVCLIMCRAFHVEYVPGYSKLRDHLTNTHTVFIVHTAIYALRSLKANDLWSNMKEISMVLVKYPLWMKKWMMMMDHGDLIHLSTLKESGYFATTFVEPRASVSSNAEERFAARLGFQLMHLQNTNKDAKFVKPNHDQSFFGKIWKERIEIILMMFKMMKDLHMIKGDVKRVELEFVAFFVVEYQATAKRAVIIHCIVNNIV